MEQQETPTSPGEGSETGVQGQPAGQATAAPEVTGEAQAPGDRIDVTEALGLLARAVLTMGEDFVYSPRRGGSCFNVPYGEIQWGSEGDPLGRERYPEGDPKMLTGCLVGTALRLSGKVPVEVLASRENCGADIAAFHEYVTGAARGLLAHAQGVQDAGSTWGEAYRAAVEYAKSVPSLAARLVLDPWPQASAPEVTDGKN